MLPAPEHAAPCRQGPCAARHAKRRCMPPVLAARKEYQVVKEEAPNGSVTLTITVPPALCQAAFNATVEELRSDVVGSLNGFRADKVPLAMIINRVGGQENFRAAVVEALLMKAMSEVMPTHAARAVPATERITSQLKQLTGGFDPARPFTFDVAYEQLPPVAWAQPYADIRVTVQDTGSLATDAAAAEDLIRQYLKEKGQQRVVSGRGLQEGDVAVLSMRVVPAGGGQPFPGLDKDMFVFDSETDPLGMVPHLLGAAPGDERRWDFTFPPDWHVDLWRGLPASATVRVQELFAYVLPEFDDAFVARHYPTFASADEMRKSLAATTGMQRLRDVQEQAQDAVVTQLAKCVEVQVPEAYLQEVAAKEYQTRLMEMLSKKLATPADLERLSSEELLQDFISNTRGELEERCKFLMGVQAVFEEQGLSVADEEVDAEVARASEQFRADGLDYDEAALAADTRAKMEVATTMAWLLENCKVEIVPWGGEGEEAARPREAVAAA